MCMPGFSTKPIKLHCSFLSLCSVSASLGGIGHLPKQFQGLSILPHAEISILLWSDGQG